MEQLRREEERRHAEREQVCARAVKLYSNTHVNEQRDDALKLSIPLL